MTPIESKRNELRYDEKERYIFNLGVQMGKDEARKEFLDVLRNKLIEHNVSNISIRVVMNELKQSLEEKHDKI